MSSTLLFQRQSHFRFGSDDWSEETAALNTAFLYINDEELKRDYTREAFRFMLAERESPDYWAVCMTFAEQRVLGLCAEARGVRARLLYDMDEDCLTHIWGAKGKLRTEKEFRAFYLDLCRDRLKLLREEDAK